MKRLFLFLLLLLAIYSAKPYWEKPVSEYIDLSFLEPVDDAVDKVITSEPFEKTVLYVSDKIDRAVHFLLSNEHSDEEPIANIEKPELKAPEVSQISIYNIEISMTEEQVIQLLGEPNQVSMNEYQTRWSTYHQDYHNFMMISYDDKRNINAIYTNDDLISSESGMRYGSDKNFVREQYGTPLTELRKGNHIYKLQNSEEFDLFEVGDLYVYVFYDIHKDNTVTAVQLIAKTLEQKRDRIYAVGNDLLRDGFERQLFDLTNASRVRHGFSALQWDDHTSVTARNHSIDMAKYNYFSHENLQGQSPFDRMKNDGIAFRAAGENLAYGQSSAIFAHEGLMNSKGHRENILQDTYSHLGVGVSFNEESQPYYTENFLLK